MSLIQEALRRKDDDNLGLPPKIIPMIVPTIRKWSVKPPEYFEEPLVMADKPTRKWLILLIALFVVTVVLIVVGLTWYTTQPRIRRGQQAKAAPVAIAPRQTEVRVVPVLPLIPPPVPPPIPPPVSLQSSWPKLKVVGVMARTAAHDVAAIIDGTLVECGDEIHGVKVHGVDPSGVWFVFSHQTQFVRVGKTTL